MDIRVYGRLLKWFAPKWRCCRRCRTPFKFVLSHITYIGMFGIAPLCVLCWRELESPIRRVPYYYGTYVEWEKKDKISFDVIREAVLKEEYKTPLQFRGEKDE